MKFNIKNYEEYALEYLEGSLLKSEQEEFAAFLLLHPEIREELESFELVTLSPDVGEVFAGKDELYRKEDGPSYRVLAVLALLAMMICSLIWLRQDRPIDTEIIAAQPSAPVESREPVATEVKTEAPKLMTEIKVGEEDIAAAQVRKDARPSIIEQPPLLSTPTEITEPDVRKETREEAPLNLTSERQEKLPTFEQTRIRQEKWNIEHLPLLKTIDQIPHLRENEKIEIIHPALIKAFSTNPEIENKLQSKVGKWLTKVNLVPSTFDKSEQSEIKNKLLPSYFSAE